MAGHAYDSGRYGGADRGAAHKHALCVPLGHAEPLAAHRHPDCGAADCGAADCGANLDRACDRNRSAYGDGYIHAHANLAAYGRANAAANLAPSDASAAGNALVDLDPRFPLSCGHRGQVAGPGYVQF